MTGQLRVLVVGPKHASHNSRGGMATVVSLMRDRRDPQTRLTTVATYVDDPVWLRWVTALTGLSTAVTQIVTGRVDVVHVHLAHGGSVVRKSVPLLAARLRHVPTVVHAHSFDFAGWFDTLPALGRSLVRWLLRADAWLVLGEGLVEPYRERLHIPRSAIRSVVNPAPLLAPGSHVPVFPVVSTGPDDEGRPDAGPATLHALGLGRMGVRKGSFDLLEALTLLDPATRAGLRVVLAGDGEVEAVRDEVVRRGLDDVVQIRDWVGPRERDELLRWAQVFLLPSYAEGMPMALLEAMAAGLAPVVSAVGAVAEVAVDDENAILVAPGDPKALAEAIRRMVDEPETRARLGAAAVSTAAQLSVDGWFAQLREVWLSLTDPSIGDRRSPP